MSISKSCMTLYGDEFLVIVMHDESRLEAHASHPAKTTPCEVWDNPDDPDWSHPFLVELLSEAMAKLRYRASLAQALLITPLED